MSLPAEESFTWSDLFSSNVFPLEKWLPKYQKTKIDAKLADEVATALQEWAIKEGATHYTHWFQPLTGRSAEKHEAFLSWSEKGAIEKLRGKELMRGESDASSLPNGGLRATHEARGYTVWDSSSPPFLWKGVLYIPALFFSWNGDALDHKIPLLRSEEKINKSCLRLLKLCKMPGERVFSTLGPEQEYFVIDRAMYEMRPDLLLAGRTVFGAPPPKGQELEDHYFGAMKERVLEFMRVVEDGAVRLGIPLKSRHNEVAPSQYEAAPLFEPSPIACDHNLMLMELMRETAVDASLACLMHEKPFAKLNGSGKHNNWSLATSGGVNLLDPKEDSMAFLILLTAILRGVYEHSGLLRASIGSIGNDHRLGGSEAPPTILSVYLGKELESIVDRLIHKKEKDKEVLRSIDLGLAHVPKHVVDHSDRNRTSFFAFTGNKFEFRAVGASAHSALPIAMINAIVADSLELILDEIGDSVENALPVIRKHLKGASPVVFGGNGYSVEWEAEAKKRGLPNIRKSFHACGEFLNKKSVQTLKGVLSEKELHSRYEIWVEQYAKMMNVELNLMVELFRTQILPAALEDQRNRGEALKMVGKNPVQKKGLETFAKRVSEAIVAIDQLEKSQKQLIGLGWEAKARVFCDLIGPKMEIARKAVDLLEERVDDRLWPLPKYREMLFSS